MLMVRGFKGLDEVLRLKPLDPDVDDDVEEEADDDGDGKDGRRCRLKLGRRSSDANVKCHRLMS